MEDCIFCKIVKGEVPSNKVYEDEKVFAFLDINPVDKGHTLVVPKEHYENIFDIPTDLMQYMYRIVKDLTEATSEALDVKEFNILQNNGRKAGQTVFHYHIHIIPKYEDFKVCFGPGERKENLRGGDEDYSRDEVVRLIQEKL